ncbi:5-oxoprolinase subunit PxpA [Nitrincola tapanii]|uniref:5-oxoprolinase subunit PxpA n=1 Tax=Nitrincola tapanii TaxID=1708751 RepID=A0A5A9W8J2_9GAMM|nr:5-oxoprolinase subunit PxpA [Nitrincola tapanii]KAA0876319.1 5-oxoprolinase subunit PxpA [Nitrincola tapanii]
MLRLNADVGESFGIWSMGLDTELIPWLDQANIACGFHASDPLIMQKTVQLTLTHSVSIGAHPSYPDLQGFGRRSLSITNAELIALLRYQIGALQAIAQAEGAKVDYVKPHGALYNDMMKNPELLLAVMQALDGLNQQQDSPLALMLLCQADNQSVATLAAPYQLPLIFEAFADRRYLANGQLSPRSQPDAVFHQPEQILQQGLSLAQFQQVETAEGPLTLAADSLCVHGDNASSVAVVAELKQALLALKDAAPNASRVR